MESLSSTTAHWQLYASGLGQSVTGAIHAMRASAPQLYPRNIVAASCGGLVAVARKITTRVAGVAISVRYELVALATVNDRGKLHIVFDEDEADKEIRIIKTRSPAAKERRRQRRRRRITSREHVS